MAETAGEGSGFFVSNRLIKVCAGLDNFNIASEAEKASKSGTLSHTITGVEFIAPYYRFIHSSILMMFYGRSDRYYQSSAVILRMPAIYTGRILRTMRCALSALRIAALSL